MVVFTQLACFAALLASAVEGKVEYKNPGHYRRQNLGSGSVSGIKASSVPSSIAKPTSSPSLSTPARASSAKIASASSAKKSSASNASGSSLRPLTTSSSSDVCSGKTLNVLQASLDWWYPQTYTYIASTFVVQYDSAGSATGWVLEPAATPFDITSAVNSPKCPPLSDGPSKTCTSTPPPVAASTTVITQTAYSTITATSGTGSVPYVAITPPPAAITIPASGGNFSAGTPFVFFSAYEILTKSPTTYAGNHSFGCVTATNTYQMTAPFSFEYTGEDPNGQVVVNAGVTGDVNPAFLGVVNITSVLAGSWVAEPTVAVVVSKVVAVSQSYLATPTPTLPSGFTSNASPTGSGQSLTPGQPNVASSDLSLQLPTYASSVSGATAQQTTSGASASPATSARTSTTTQSPTNALGVLSAALSTIPTDALGVLSAAEATFTSAAKATGGASVPNKAVTVPVMTFAGSTMTANSASDFVLDGGSATLVPGGAALTISGTTISMAAGGSVVVVNGVSQTLSRSAALTAGAAAVATTAAQPVIVVAGSTYTGSGGSYLIAGQTLTPGGAVTFAAASGAVETVSLNAAGNTAVIAASGTTVTSALQTGSSSTGGAAIPTGAAGPSLAPGSGGKTTSTPAPATGGGAMQRAGLEFGFLGYALTGLLGAVSFGFAALL